MAIKENIFITIEMIEPGNFELKIFLTDDPCAAPDHWLSARSIQECFKILKRMKLNANLLT